MKGGDKIGKFGAFIAILITIVAEVLIGWGASSFYQFCYGGSEAAFWGPIAFWVVFLGIILPFMIGVGIWGTVIAIELVDY